MQDRILLIVIFYISYSDHKLTFGIIEFILIKGRGYSSRQIENEDQLKWIMYNESHDKMNFNQK